MCGIVACITKTRNGFNYGDADLFGEMLFADTLRGKDSTGVFAVNNLGNVGIVKDALTAEAFLETQEYKDIRTEIIKDGWAIVGHNRKATRGMINNENAHPFWVEDKLVLVHNGSYVGDHKKLADVAVDSHAIAIHLAGNIENYEVALRQVNAAYAFIFYDIENKKLNIIRNKERPLFKVETSTAYFFASEGGILSWILSRNNEKPIGKIELLDEHVLYQFELRDHASCTHSEKKLDCSFRYSNTNSTIQTDQYSDDEAEYYAAMRQYACAYSDTRTRQHPYANADQTPDQQTSQSYTTTDFDKQRKLHGLCVPDIRHPHFKYSVWMNEINDKHYKKGSRIQVIVDDWVQPDSTVREFFLTGKCLDEVGSPVIFSVTGIELDTLIENIKEDNLLFDIEIEKSVWKRDGEVLPTSTTALDNIDGVVFVIGKNHQIVLGNSNGQTH
jgi:hypothetical protein